MLPSPFLLFFLLATFPIFSRQQGGDLDKLIDDIFNPNQGSSDSPATSSSTTTATPEVKPNVGGIPGTGDCDCVAYYLCNNGTINTNGEGIIDIRINEGPCDSYLDVCCNKADIRETPLTTTPPPVTPPKGCGIRHPDGVGFRITGDGEHESQFGEFPWMVAILREESVEGNPQKLNVYQCGGALIHPKAILTAAHCVSAKGKTYRIRAGEWDTQHTKELYPHQDREVETIKIHPQYYAGALYNDIAVLILKSPVDIAENVDVVCLPPQGSLTTSGRCLATGWGKDTFGKQGKYQVILKKVDLPVVPNDECQERLRKTRLGKFFELHRSFMCAGGEPDKDTCKGDGGSPLVCPIEGQRNRFYQAGIVAWGIGCGENSTPGVYANVAVFRDWIDEQMKLHQLDVGTYQY